MMDTEQAPEVFSNGGDAEEENARRLWMRVECRKNGRGFPGRSFHWARVCETRHWYGLWWD